MLPSFTAGEQGPQEQAPSQLVAAEDTTMGLRYPQPRQVELDETVADGLPSATDLGHSPLSDSIVEGKQKAKAILAASTISPSQAARQSSRSDLPESSPSQTGLAQTPHAPRPTTRELHLDQYVTRDHLDAAALSAQSSAYSDLVHSKRKEIEYFQQLRRERQMNPAAVFGPGYAGYGNGHTEGKSRVVYPARRKRPGGRKTRELRISKKDMAAQADQIEELVPVRLDVDMEKLKLRDTFTWNLHERTITPEYFAENLVEDFKLPPDQARSAAQSIAHSIKDQVQNFYPHVFIEEEALDPHLPYHAYKNDDMRILIKLNITIGQHTLVDQFEWDINNPLNSPEDFARHMSRDLSLSGEFTTAIAHSIREQIQLFTKSLYVIGHPFDGRPIEDPDLRESFLPSPPPSVFRPMQQAKEFSPYLWELNESDLDKTENSLSREQRRQKRSVNRRGGPALPDLKDRQRTVRTLVVSSVIPGAAESLEESRLLKRPEGASGRPGRRGGAGARGGDDSDLSESEESAPESPPVSNNQLVFSSSTRTRAVRGAATAAQQAMRAGTIGRSATPEISVLHHHETRTSARKLGAFDYREDSVDEPSSLIVKLSINRDRLRQLEQDQARLVRPPSPPDWLTSGLALLQRSYPDDSFQGSMRYAVVDSSTGAMLPDEVLRQQPLPPNAMAAWLPRIKCNDCPNKLYTPGPENTVENFEVHLKNVRHRENVQMRTGK